MDAIARPRPLRGVVLVVASLLIFASMDPTGKFLFQPFPIVLVQPNHYSVNLVLVVALF
jgi:hypothetical protein